MGTQEQGQSAEAVDAPAEAIAQVEVPTSALTGALKRMRRLGRKTPGLASWTFGPDGVTVAWMGMSERIAGQGAGHAVLAVDGKLMPILASGTGWGPSVRVSAWPDSLRVGTSVFGAELREVAPPALLPLNTSPVDVLRLYVREAPSLITEAGLDEAVGEVLERLHRSCAAAESSLRWLGVTTGELRAWLLARLEAPSPQAGPEVVIVEPGGQVRMFDD